MAHNNSIDIKDFKMDEKDKKVKWIESSHLLDAMNQSQPILLI